MNIYHDGRDPRVAFDVGKLIDALAGRRAEHVLLAVALLANGESGTAALKNLAADNSGSAMHASGIAEAALRLREENS